MRQNLGTIIAVSVLLPWVMCSCSSEKKLETQSSMEVLQRRSGHIEDILHSEGLKESWVVPVERNGVVVYDTIRHRIDLNDTLRHRVHVNDTVRSQVLSEQTKGKVPQKQIGLRETIQSVGKESKVSSVALVISIGINVILIFVILSVFFLKKGS